MDSSILLNAGEYLAALMVGLLGGIHCLGMCGGIVSALTFSLPPQQRQQKSALFPILVAYNMGRISSYVIAGALAGGLGAAFLNTVGLETVRHSLQIIAALFTIALGLYLAGVWFGVAKIENAGRILWKYIEPFGRRFIPVTNPGKALPLGFIWGWLPCGLVYSVLIWSLSTGSASKGALLMAAFGLGTLPNLLLMGTAAARLASFTRNPLIKKIAGFSIVVLGLSLLANSF
ncbi:MAG: sulfite exporter TauE/SafE family protein [Thiotrichaceae bacterium]|jgi:hypothetical protein